MARCKGCIHDNVCNREVGYGYSVCPHHTTADVVQRAELDKARQDGYENGKREVAREILEEIEELRLKHTYGEIDEADLNIGLYMLKKKYGVNNLKRTGTKGTKI